MELFHYPKTMTKKQRKAHQKKARARRRSWWRKVRRTGMLFGWPAFFQAPPSFYQ